MIDVENHEGKIEKTDSHRYLQRAIAALRHAHNSPLTYRSCEAAKYHECQHVHIKQRVVTFHESTKHGHGEKEEGGNEEEATNEYGRLSRFLGTRYTIRHSSPTKSLNTESRCLSSEHDSSPLRWRKVNPSIAPTLSFFATGHKSPVETLLRYYLSQG